MWAAQSAWLAASDMPQKIPARATAKTTTPFINPFILLILSARQTPCGFSYTTRQWCFRLLKLSEFRKRVIASGRFLWYIE